ncbi:DNA-3-methyladenine glycosylase [Fictibacillus phosphorivorans]|uniref:DNA-3-methyladenine glycosylase II n=1 Tax=Fictibacillus phosphorivorans TaxID=1221500 RepID=A0A165P467_9BACL|nr:DNA-3-methyladenine glycosylase [Fictibacillus phosphorivorans]KZE68915.1 DNA-3-methyladenine glycosylase [Fictibacillus phosphorivorans]
MQWTDRGDHLEIHLPKEFSFSECLTFLGRSPLEVMHDIQDATLYKLLKVDEDKVLLNICCNDQKLIVSFPDNKTKEKETVVRFISEWFDLERDLSVFYEAVSSDPILKPLTNKYYGLRMIGIPDLFEALTWAIMGQQINLTFAYTLKQRFVENFGEKVSYQGRLFWLYPEPERIARLETEQLRKLQFTERKAQYVIGIAKEMCADRLSKIALQDSNHPGQLLISLRGVGAWTADYCLMKCLLNPDAFPIADVGLHNAVMKQLKQDRKPTINELKEIAKKWSGWEAYATFYLWRSLYE